MLPCTTPSQAIAGRLNCATPFPSLDAFLEHIWPSQEEELRAGTRTHRRNISQNIESDQMA